MFEWIKALTKKRQTRQQWADVTANNMYDALILDGGPGGNTKLFSDFYVPKESQERFDDKNREKLEAFVYFSLVGKNSDSSESLMNDLSMAFIILLRKKWRACGFGDEKLLEAKFESEATTYELFATKPIDWAKHWMSEFFQSEDPDKNWGAMLFLEHSLKQHAAIKNFIDGLLK